ncbi:aspartyl-phosphate phosphatase Spo0E family protein [Paenibacillus sp. HWE-109]|uniref:aspartyl-phosphate phosphatase Spo0E family protein n=1 Tax=Paenibacillus sp. HWE-109 TaxID=1306526 RepID=UPI001EDF9E59|nr:aspartyl-phosphate phosphatase Spo0E family protein [Paenibacillus sp. HWE-109]UKS30994.1 aspartyl-phosphate phosphatase Spo0E family protein [Paenibacillus sp. HWE-109]
MPFFVTEPQERLNIEIEQLRSQMVSLGNAHGFLHPDVQQCSRELDLLLLQYYALRPKQ